MLGTLVLDLGLSWLGFEQLTYRLWGERSNPLRNRCGSMKKIKITWERNDKRWESFLHIEVLYKI